MSTNVLRAGPSIIGKKFAENASKKLSNMANEGASMLLNPMVESFLSFNINNNNLGSNNGININNNNVG
jgi:hypothetical protein